MFLNRKKRVPEKVLNQYIKDRASLKLVRAELDDMRTRHMRNLFVEKELSRTIRRVDDALRAIDILIGG